MAPSVPEFPVEGGCQCGAVRYKLKAAPLAVYACHCKDCQRFSGTTHSISMVVPADQLQLTLGVLSMFEKSADSGRIVRMLGCQGCGTKIWNEPANNPDMLILKAGTLDDLSWAAPVGNIWTASKAPWVDLDENVPNFEQQPASRQPLIEAWAAAHQG
jgi:hypothetical protein